MPHRKLHAGAIPAVACVFQCNVYCVPGPYDCSSCLYRYIFVIFWDGGGGGKIEKFSSGESQEKIGVIPTYTTVARVRGCHNTIFYGYRSDREHVSEHIGWLKPSTHEAARGCSWGIRRKGVPTKVERNDTAYMHGMHARNTKLNYLWYTVVLDICMLFVEG